MAGPTDAVYEGQALKVGGDAIVAIDGIPVTNAEDVVRIVSERLLPGETVALHGRPRRPPAGRPRDARRTPDPLSGPGPD